jgi:CBS domain-containing protein
VVLRLHQPGDPITRGQEEVEPRLRQPDQSLGGGAPPLLRGGQLDHAAILSTLLVGSAPVQIREIMTASVVTASPGEAVQEVAALMRDRGVGSVVLVDEAGRPVGMVTDRDLAIGALADGADPGLPAVNCATSPVVTGESGMDLEEAAALMVSHKIRRLPVMDEGELVGIVTLDDIAVRTGNLEVAQRMTAQVAQAVFPDFYFHMRGG